MGKIALILVLSVTVLFGTIIVSNTENSADLPQKIAHNESEMLGNKLSNYAISYSIKNLVDNKINLSADETRAIGYNDFNIFNGRIDSIIYRANSNLDTIRIDCKTTYNVAGQYNSHYRTAHLKINSSSTNYDFNAAIVTAGTIRFRGHGSVVGDVKENQNFTFEEVFGISAEEMKSTAQGMGTYFENPSNHQVIGDEISWMEGDFHPTAWWNGSGILIVNGDFKMTAHSVFEGVLYVTGEFEMTSHTEILGTVFIQHTGRSDIKAHSIVIYNEDEINDNLTVLPAEESYELVIWE